MFQLCEIRKLIHKSKHKKIYKIRLSKFLKQDAKFMCKIEYNSIYDINDVVKVLKILNGGNGIIKLYRYNISCLNKNIYTEYCSMDLFEWVVKYGEKIEKFTIMKIYIRLFNILVYCHSKGVIHSDIKLENIGIINDNINDLRLFDFDDAIILDDIKEDYISTKNICKTPHYEAPELKKELNIHKSNLHLIDFWSLGVVMFCIVFNRFPDERGDDELRNLNRKDEKYEIKRIIKNLLTRSTRKRLQNLELLKSSELLRLNLYDSI